MTDPRAEAAVIVREFKLLLEQERRRGRARIALGPAQAPVPPLVPPSLLPGPAFAPVPQHAQTLALPGFESVAPGSLVPSSDLPDNLPELQRLVAECRKCTLCGTRTQTVFGDGSATARLVFVGEAPGRDEDLKGVPFVGRAGQLLDKMIAAIGMRRQDVYICNVLKCRPPENRTPHPGEVEQCAPYLERQIELIRPALLCALGLSAAQALLGTKASMSSLRGRTFAYRGIPLIPTYHPAALLRNPHLKREAWEDMQRVRDTLKSRSGA